MIHFKAQFYSCEEQTLLALGPAVSTAHILCVEIGNREPRRGELALEPADLIQGKLPFSPACVDVERGLFFDAEALSPLGCEASPAFVERVMRQRVTGETERYWQHAHAGAESNWLPGMPIRYAGRVFDHNEMMELVHASLDFWLTSGRFYDEFERSLGRYLGVRYVKFVNSGSSANLLAFSALCSPLLEERQLKPGDEVITVAAGFPTTVAPIIQNGCVPVFVDIKLPGYNIDVSRLEAALTEKTKAIFVAHTLGNPVNVAEIRAFCDLNRLWFVEDNCDALGSRYFFEEKWQMTGTFGHIATSSFYPPHHMTTGEGGAVYTNSPKLARIVESLRDWGRDCWCPSGRDNTCGKRFGWALGDLPPGYDHKYIYRHFGYNLKATDLQAAIGCAQLKKLPQFGQARRQNWLFLRERLESLSHIFVLPEPEPHSDPSWFGFLLTILPEAPLKRNELVVFLEEKGVQTRMLFAGNLTRHPCFVDYKQSGGAFRVVDHLNTTNLVMERSFWLGVYPGMTNAMLSFVVDTLQDFCKKYR